MYQAGNAIKVTGLSYRQLDNIVRNRLLRPSHAAAQGRGSVRSFNERDLIALRERRFSSRKSGTNVWSGLRLGTSPMGTGGGDGEARDDREDEGRRIDINAFPVSYKALNPIPGPNPPFRPIRSPDPATRQPANDRTPPFVSATTAPSSTAPPAGGPSIRAARDRAATRRDGSKDPQAEQHLAERTTDEAIDWQFGQVRAGSMEGS